MTSNSKKRLLRFSAALFLFMLILCAMPALAQTDDKATKTETAGIKPNLQIKIPTVKFSDVSTEAGGIMSLPWLAEYIAGVYKYGVAIGAFLAAIMVIVGGFIYLTSGDSGRTQQAKTIITDAILGLAVLLGSYTLLYVVNPQLTQLKPIELPIVEADMFEALSLQTTTSATADATGGQSATFTQGFQNCPITLSAPPAASGNPKNNARSIEFAQKIGAAITATSMPDRIAQVASAMVQCQAYFGCCGRTVGSAMAIAGANGSDMSCLNDKNGCWTQYNGRTVKTMPTSLRKQLWTIRCNRKCRSNMAKYAANTSDCVNGVAASRQKAKTLVSSWMAANPWKELLQPGDFVSIYNGNDDCTGGHAQSFLGWQNKATGKAYTLNGQAGRFPKIRVTCLDFSCGTIITQIKRPR